VHLARRHVFPFEHPKTRPRGRDILQITCRMFLPVRIISRSYGIYQFRERSTPLLSVNLVYWFRSNDRSSCRLNDGIVC
jgi:hypothetical protein